MSMVPAVVGGVDTYADVHVAAAVDANGDDAEGSHSGNRHAPHRCRRGRHSIARCVGQAVSQHIDNCRYMCDYGDI